MMSLSFQNTASALCYSIIHQRCPSRGATCLFPNNAVVNFVLQQHRRMPDFLKLPIIILTLVFDLWGLIQAGAPFHQLPHSNRWQQIQVWQHSPFGFCRDLIRFYEGLTIFGWYSSTLNEPRVEE